MSNYALERILVLWFVIPNAGTKVNSHAIKLHPTCGALFGVNYSYEIIRFLVGRFPIFC